MRDKTIVSKKKKEDYSLITTKGKSFITSFAYKMFVKGSQFIRVVPIYPGSSS